MKQKSHTNKKKKGRKILEKWEPEVNQKGKNGCKLRSFQRQKKKYWG